MPDSRTRPTRTRPTRTPRTRTPRTRTRGIPMARALIRIPMAGIPTPVALILTPAIRTPRSRTRRTPTGDHPPRVRTAHTVRTRTPRRPRPGRTRTRRGDGGTRATVRRESGAPSVGRGTRIRPRTPSLSGEALVDGGEHRPDRGHGRLVGL